MGVCGVPCTSLCLERGLDLVQGLGGAAFVELCVLQGGWPCRVTGAAEEGGIAFCVCVLPGHSDAWHPQDHSEIQMPACARVTHGPTPPQGVSCVPRISEMLF